MYIELLADIVSIREEKVLTQRDIAEMTGLKQSAIARFENLLETSNALTLLIVINSLGCELSLKPKKE